MDAVILSTGALFSGKELRLAFNSLFGYLRNDPYFWIGIWVKEVQLTAINAIHQEEEEEEA